MRQFAYNNLPVIPLRSHPDDRSEMVSQVLFGEHFFVNETFSHWAKITLINDEYQGWIDQKAVQKTTNKSLKELQSFTTFLTSELFTKVSCEEDSFYIPIGSVLPDYYKGKFTLGETQYSINTEVAPFSFEYDKFSEVCKKFLKAPYLWGGKTSYGIDCSGYTQVVLGQFGINIKRDASMQAKQGRLVAFLAEAQMGDLAFFENEDGNITHVGIILSPDTIIHAHGEVRIDAIDDMGIINKKTGKHSHRLRLLKRYF